MQARFSKVKYLNDERDLVEDVAGEISLVPFNNDMIPIPDFKNKVVLVNGSNYIVGVTSRIKDYSFGWIYAGTTTRSADNQGTIEINGLKSALTGYDTVYESDTAGCGIFLPVKYGDSFTVSILDGVPRIYFIPVKLL